VTQELQLQFLGTGTSTGVPAIGCDCAVCRSDSPRNKRLRCAALVRAGDTTVVVDTGPDFRTQMLRADVKRLDAVLLTHSHADHIVGLDDVRRYNYLQKQVLDCWALPETLDIVRRAFGYAFRDTLKPGLPGLQAKPFRPGEAFTIGELEVTPLAVDHVVIPCAGFVFRQRDKTERIAYMVDCKRLPPATEKALEEIDILVLDMLRPQEHPRHFNLEEALTVVDRLRPGETWFTHAAHEVEHATIDEQLPRGIRMAYDGLVIRLTETAS